MPGHPLPGWCWLDGSKTASHRRIEFKTAAPPLKNRLEGIDVLCGVVRGEKRHVGPVAPVDGTFQATPEDLISPGALGSARGGTVKFALLADEGSPLSAGVPVRCKRIQLLMDGEWRRKYPNLRAYADDLNHLPIVVPV